MAIDIKLKTGIPRFEQIGDWPEYDLIVVSPLPDEKYEFLIALHEFVEAQLCKFAGITPAQVDEFDSNWKGEGEPGDDPNCPYQTQHNCASLVEMLVCHELGINWTQYNVILNKLNEVKHG